MAKNEKPKPKPPKDPPKAENPPEPANSPPQNRVVKLEVPRLKKRGRTAEASDNEL